MLKNLILWPLSILYGIGISIRNRLFNLGILKIREFDIPIICVGNITVGGTGKTPHTESLINELKNDYRVACLSRGYKRKTSGFVLATETSTANEIGDEPMQIKNKFPNSNFSFLEGGKETDYKTQPTDSIFLRLSGAKLIIILKT